MPLNRVLYVAWRVKAVALLMIGLWYDFILCTSATSEFGHQVLELLVGDKSCLHVVSLWKGYVAYTQITYLFGVAMYYCSYIRMILKGMSRILCLVRNAHGSLPVYK